jgi:hypothetical protein
MQASVAPEAHFGGFVQARTDSLLSTAFGIAMGSVPAKMLACGTTPVPVREKPVGSD